MKKLSNLSLFMIGIGAMLIIMAIIISIQPRPKTTSLNPPVSEEESFPELPRVSLNDAFSAFTAGSAVFVDVRDNSAFAEAHIPGALSIPLGQLESQGKELDPNAWIITYCT
ncbi:MAG: hypothetical protein CVU46_01970 [Chloroflexi bacterium HGW-Chloroflexi-8]|jgi:3-mercaptopyruvate sulfurtransferase SseA|nr:MAG: hypothetical protein CVU46_01970 [Chloroflexi bacterium HGW-Chloroflexi-8]